MAVQGLTLALLVGFTACDLIAPPETIREEDFVDLRPVQTVVRSQGSRTTCIVFAGVAALEAAYRRAGYGELNFSEEFMNFTRKAFYLHPIWSDVEMREPDGLETQIGAHGGGGGSGTLRELAKGFRVPAESVMPYRSTESYYRTTYPDLQVLEADLSANKQRDVSTFNLNPAILSSSVLRADTFYSARTVRDVADPRDPLQLEAVLRRGFEVVWDFAGANPQAPGGTNDDGVWQVCADCGLIGHAMLLVGYDKRDPDPSKHYFIVKNSWGGAMASDSDNFTYISYDYVRNYGVAASYVTAVEPPGPWPEIAFIGRWHLNFSGHRGELDIYHIPGMARETFEWNYDTGRIDSIPVDQRIGSFYDSLGNAFKVNGTIPGNRIEFYIDGTKPALPWDELSGRRFVYYLDSNDFMAGIHTDPDGSTWGGYARKGGYLPSHGIANSIRPVDETSYVGTNWRLYTELDWGTVAFTSGAYNQSEGYYLYGGTYTPAGSTTESPVQMKVETTDTGRTMMQILSYGPGGGTESFIGELFSHEPGFIAGHTEEVAPVYPFYMVLY